MNAVESKPKLRRVGLARALSKLGYCSRSQATELVRAGRVRLNGSVRCDPETPAHLERDRIAVDDSSVRSEEKIYLMMNKPRGVVTTASDERGRETVYSVLAKANSADHRSAKSQPWLSPVGRLDKASEGLLLLTNDSEWAAHVTAPETHLDKTYHVQIAKVVDEKFAQSLVDGARDKGKDEVLCATKARVLRSGKKNCWLEIVLDEGKNRQIRRMLAAFNIEVRRLVRVAIGPLELGKLAKGTVRPLSAEEKRALDRTMRANRL